VSPGEHTLSSGELEAVFVPGAGMVGRSLRHRGEELLPQRGGLGAYTERGKTFGIPLLHPWANRLATSRFEVAGREVDLERDGTPVRFDHGLPIPGRMAAAPGWEVERGDATGLRAAYDFGADPVRAAAFPFPHRIVLDVALAAPTLTVRATVEPTGDVPVPIAFGFHPYLQIPGVARAEWAVDIPVREGIVLDDRLLPTGERAPAAVDGGALGGRTFDDAYLAPPGGAPFVLAGGGRRIELALGPSYRFAQVFAPEEEDLIAYEPMAAPANALVTGADLPLVAPGETWSAGFTVTVLDA
jgi:galactose mutarotase-like enzyme